jgi:basic membrane protein A
MRWGVCCAALLLLAASPSRVKSETVYFDNFDESPIVASGVSATLGGVTTTAPVEDYAGLGIGSNTFEGEFLRNTTGGPLGQSGLVTTLTLTDLPSHTSVEINFLLAIIDSWDGSEPGGCTDCHPDILTVTVDGTIIFSESFGFNGPTFDPPPGSVLAEYLPLGFNGDYDDSAYNMGLVPAFDGVPHRGKSLTIEWVASGAGWQGGNDESWAIDNVEVVLGKGKETEKVCVVYEPGGNESVFNRAVAAGVEHAARTLQVELATLDAEEFGDLGPNILEFVDSGDCDLIMGVGFLVWFAMEPITWEYPEQQFAMIDSGSDFEQENVAQVLFQVDEAAFLAGYIAAGISETGIVGTFGGWDIIPAVIQFMDGFSHGVDFYNIENDAAVEVLPYEFTEPPFDPDAARAIATSMYENGADTVFPVAGAAGFEALDVAALRNAEGYVARVIGVDFDWYAEFGDPDRVILTSAVKNLGNAAYDQIQALVDDTWTSGVFWVGLEEDSVDIAPFYKLNDQVPGYLKNDLKGIREGIIDDSIPTLP